MADLIKRQAVLNYPIRINHYDEEHGNRDFVLGIESVMEYVESLPSAKRETGAWVGIDDFPHQEWECNQCGKIVYTDSETGIEEYEFCPHCGAEMLNAEGDGGAEWVETSGGEHYKCSRCGFRAPYYLSTDREPCEWLSDFCPNCGKLMWKDGEE